jgi:hypothetical protein
MTTAENEQKEQYIAIWTKAVDTQMHFNEMSVKSRQLGLTFVAAALGLGIVLLSRGDAFSYPIKVSCIRFQINIAVLLPIAALLALNAVKQLDLNVYHQMLRGAVAFGEDFEATYMKQVFDLEKGMTQAISHFSRYSDAQVERAKGASRLTYSGSNKVTAETKIRGFYRSAKWFLGITTVILFLITNANYWLNGDAQRRSQSSATQTLSAPTHENSARTSEDGPTTRSKNEDSRSDSKQE